MRVTIIDGNDSNTKSGSAQATQDVQSWSTTERANMLQDMQTSSKDEAGKVESSSDEVSKDAAENETKPVKDWLKSQIEHLKGLKSPTDQQKLLIALAEQPSLTDLEKRKFEALVKSERAQVRAREARKAANRILNAERIAESKLARKNRTHEMMKSAGLLSLAGLIDKNSGIPNSDISELVGALISLNETLQKLPKNDPRRLGWIEKGSAALKA